MQQWVYSCIKGWTEITDDEFIKYLKKKCVIYRHESYQSGAFFIRTHHDISKHWEVYIHRKHKKVLSPWKKTLHHVKGIIHAHRR